MRFLLYESYENRKDFLPVVYTLNANAFEFRPRDFGAGEILPPPLIFPQLDLGHRADSCWALPQICILGLSSAFCRNSALVELCAACEKFTENPFLGGSRSFKVIDVDKSQKPVTSACYDKHMSVPLSNHFLTIRSNSSKTTSL